MSLLIERRPDAIAARTDLQKANANEQQHTGSNPSPQAVWNRANKEKLKAHRAVAAAIARGELKREPCFICGAPNAQAHHRSYRPEYRLRVSFLCPKHHRRLHAVWAKCEVPEI